MPARFYTNKEASIVNGLKYQVAGIDDHVGIITLNRPAALNAMNTETINELRALLAEIDDRHIFLSSKAKEVLAFWDN